MTETAEARISRVAQEIENDWKTNPRWKGVKRTYTADKVARLQGSVTQEHTLARMGAEKLWQGLHDNDYIHALGAITGNQAVEMAKAGLKAIYLSGWQVAGDGNSASETYPDQSLYPYDSVPKMVKRINNALVRADQVDYSEGKNDVDYFLPIVADAEAGFGGPLNAYELAKHLIEAGAAGMHYEDQLSSAKKCGHLGGKVLIPTQQHIINLEAARLAADVEGVPTLLVARTDSLGANLITSDVDEIDKPFLTGERSSEGHYYTTPGADVVIARLLAFAPYADLLWVETNTPDPALARQVAEAVKKEYPDKMLAYNCSPSFNWRANLSDDEIAKFQKELGAMGYAFQFITLAGFHQINYGMFDLAYGYAREGMTAYVRLQQAEFDSESRGYTATKHQREVGAGYFDLVSTTVNPESSTLALKGSTEEAQF
ncbi:MAG: isocitrate lyase [Mobiluncus porci]|uniref:Isocitrate lyase n=1 Tax=Mobiluncus porci TaxID=2652278 RepID=A0A7K0K2P6_9ACTO|nr:MULTISPECIES: isocitrate lyase [Mobiluncus]MCI6585471.1 isocitrate lyase [Mobiluncus sp.]MDD7541320.1 isocitrate lyase [Mobiluncus porci]MDY5747803.1 isocitrate lyase [Mobiluncus porci]MST49684.1 isocitrate lyase [Mobiluncus porci]